MKHLACLLSLAALFAACSKPKPVLPPKDEPVKAAPANLPYGTPVSGKNGFITSPYAPDSGYIDVRGYTPGTEVKDPYTGKLFLVP